MGDLITVRPKVKQKGFNSDNIGISAFTEEDMAVDNRILRMTHIPYFNDLSSSHKKLVNKICKGYKNKLEGKPIPNNEYVLSGHELVEFENVHDWELFRYLVYRYKYNLYPLLKIYDDYPPCVQYFNSIVKK